MVFRVREQHSGEVLALKRSFVNNERDLAACKREIQIIVRSLPLLALLFLKSYSLMAFTLNSILHTHTTFTLLLLLGTCVGFRVLSDTRTSSDLQTRVSHRRATGSSKCTCSCSFAEVCFLSSIAIRLWFVFIFN